ncbi:MAG: HAD family phosphatase [Spirochaetota bacterium]|nr:MAG: HAD family phosphatase [Spirochaetota bacterium]
MKYKLFACDLDGTLLDDKKKISKKNLQYIKKANQAGVRVVITTGRSYNKTMEFIKTVDVPDPAVTFTGAVIYQNGKVLRETTLKPDLVYDILIHLKNIGYNPIVYPADNNKYYESLGGKGTEYYRFSRGFDGSLIHVKNLTEKQWERVIRVSVIGNVQDMLILHRKVRERFGDKVTTVDTYFKEWNVCIFEVLDHRCSKSKALEFLCNIYEIGREEVIACGDNNNDIDMIRWAGFGVSMKNGMKDLLNEADYVTERDNNNNGIAEIIEKFMLNS